MRYFFGSFTIRFETDSVWKKNEITQKDETLFSEELKKLKLISFFDGKRKHTERECLLQKGHTINNYINSHIEQRKASTLHTLYISLPVDINRYLVCTLTFNS